MQTSKYCNDTVMIDQAYAKTSVYCNARLMNKRQKQKNNSDVTENLRYKAQNVMHHLTGT